MNLERATTIDHLRENVRRFARDAASYLSRSEPLCSQAIYWVFDAGSGDFAPSKFVGYKNMTFSGYETAIAHDSTGAHFDGTVARLAAERVLQPFVVDERLRAMLKEWLSRSVSPSARHGERLSFATIPSHRKYWALACNPNVFDGLGAVRALPTLAWTVDRGDFTPGDRILLWQGKGGGDRRGVIALGEVERGAELVPGPPDERTFWKEPVDGTQERIRFRVIPSSRLPLWESPEHPWLSDLAVAKSRGGTVFSLEPWQWYAALGGAATETVEIREDRLAASTRQGYGLTTPEKRAVERHAQRMAEEHLISLGYDVKDVSRGVNAFATTGGNPYDLHCTKGAEELRVEVKGTTGLGEAVLLTANEVTHARLNRAVMALAVVSGVVLDRSRTPPVASGGTLNLVRPWSVDEGTLTPTQFEHTLPRKRGAL